MLRMIAPKLIFFIREITNISDIIIGATIRRSGYCTCLLLIRKVDLKSKY